MKGSRSRRAWSRRPGGVRRGCSPHRPEQFAALARRLRAERLASVSIVRQIGEWVAEERLVFLDRSWITVGVADGLASASGEVVDQFPEQALTLVMLARSVAARLDETYPPALRASVQGAAWTQLAAVHRRAGNPELALPVLECADLLLQSSPWLAFERPNVGLERARTLHALGRREEALAALDAAVAVLAGFAGVHRMAECAALRHAIARSSSPASPGSGQG